MGRTALAEALHDQMKKERLDGNQRGDGARFVIGSYVA